MSIVSHFSLAQYELMAQAGAFSGEHHQRVEFIRGEIRQMSPIGPRHAYIIDCLTAWSFDSSDRERTIVRIQSSARMPEIESEPEPDVLWLAKRDYSTRHPEPREIQLLIEVADSSLTRDLGEKANLYAEAGLDDYWVVDLVEDCVHVFRQPRPSGYATHEIHRGAESISPLCEATAILQPAKLFEKP